MAILVLIALLVGVAWIINGLHKEGMENLRKQRTATYPFRRSSGYPRPTFTVIDVKRKAS